MAQTPNNAEKLAPVRAVLLDMDGVLYVGDSPLPGVQDFLDYLTEQDIQWLCVTNNASKTPDMFSEKLARMQVSAGPEHVLGSAQATAMWLADEVRGNGAEPGKVIMLGMEGLREALREQGFDAVHVNEAGRTGLSDPEQLAYAARENRAILTHNAKDFVPLAVTFYFDKQSHAGIILARQGEKGELLRLATSLLNDLSAEELAGTVRHLPDF